jgi:outer membrane protein OmpA-like peptidoglycan-associated protein
MSKKVYSARGHKVFKNLIMTVSMAAAGAMIASTAMADSANVIVTKSSQTERYVPTIWVDPDGCEHWAMDDGAEGYMTPHVTRDGIPVCNRGKTCAVMNSDQLFAVDKWYINATNRARLQKFFKSSGASTYLIDGHTDSDASDAYNMRLSKNRAVAVAKVAQSAGATAQARWYGERVPLASNSTRAGKAKNRRVEITCIR